MSLENIAQEVLEEIYEAERKFGPFNSSHEGYAVILEELDELWEVVKLNPNKIEIPGVELIALRGGEIQDRQCQKRKQRMREEAIQVAAMAIRFIKCICDEGG